MDAIEKIIKRIEEDAQWKIEEYYREADEEIARIRKIEEGKWEKEREKLEAAGKREAETIRQMHVSKAHLDGKKMLMQAREEVIEKVIKDMLENFRSYGDYDSYLKSSLEDASKVLGEKFMVISLADDKERISSLASELGLSVSVTPGEVENGGFIGVSQDSTMRVDYTAKAFVERNMGEIRKMIHEKLFGEEYA